MAKPGIWLIISLVFVCLVTAFLWLGKTPFTAVETSGPDLSSPQTAQPTDPEPVGEPDDEDDEVALNDTGTNDSPPSGDSPPMDESLPLAEDPGDPAQPEALYPETLTDLFLMNAGPLELPVEGATGWAGTAMPLYSEADTESRIMTDFDAGQVFVILKEQGDWWYVNSSGGETGWVGHAGCLINLPDVITSIAYNITNAYSARTRSSGYAIPGVTGTKLYDAFAYNPRLYRYEFIVPALYSTSKLICAAQQHALKAGDTIIIYEAYRAHASQMRSLNLLRELIENNAAVDEAINAGPWNISWFMATTISNHQRGASVDAGLGKILSYEIIRVGEVFFASNVTYEEYDMPTDMHELSPLAISLTTPVPSSDRDAWREIPDAATMTPGAVLLRSYFDKAKLTPIASEWWHFNDIDGVEAAKELDIAGVFFIDEILSVLP